MGFASQIVNISGMPRWRAVLSCCRVVIISKNWGRIPVLFLPCILWCVTLSCYDPYKRTCPYTDGKHLKTKCRITEFGKLHVVMYFPPTWGCVCSSCDVAFSSVRDPVPGSFSVVRVARPSAERWAPPNIFPPEPGRALVLLFVPSVHSKRCSFPYVFSLLCQTYCFFSSPNVVALVSFLCVLAFIS